MQIEIPECKRCFCCVPLRHGILTFGYVNLVFSLLCIALELFIGMDDFAGYTMTTYHGNGFITRSWLALLLYSLDVCFLVVLLVGAHMKQIKLLTIYFYYGITTGLATVMTVLLIDVDLGRDFIYTLVYGCLIFLGIVLHVYLLCLVWNLIRKLRKSTGLTFVNHMSEVVVDPFEERAGNPL